MASDSVSSLCRLSKSRGPVGSIPWSPAHGRTGPAECSGQQRAEESYASAGWVCSWTAGARGGAGSAMHGGCGSGSGPCPGCVPGGAWSRVREGRLEMVAGRWAPAELPLPERRQSRRRPGGRGRGAGGAGGLRVGEDPEGRGRARAAHARCIVLTENAVCFESSGGGAERVPPADGEADPLQVSASAAAAGTGAGRERPRALPAGAPRSWAWVPPPGAAWGPVPPPSPAPRAIPGVRLARPPPEWRLDSGRVDHHPTRAATA